MWFIYLFIGKFCLVYLASVSDRTPFSEHDADFTTQLMISIAAIRTTRSLRRAFFEQTIRQEIWHFDKRSTSGIATQVTTNSNTVGQGIAEKLSFVVQSLATFFAAFIVALVAQWKLSLITMSIIPLIFLVTGSCVAIDVPQEARIVRIYSEASNLAQEALSSIRTIHAFGALKKIARQYDEYLQRAHALGNKKSPNFGAMFCVQYFSVYAGIAVCFWQGFRMYQNGEVADAGQVFK